MKTILYAGSELLTGDAIADAVMALGHALAKAQTAESIDIPVAGSSGRCTTVSMLVGPTSQIVALPTATDIEELVDDDLVAELRGRIRRLQPTLGATDDAPDDRRWDDVV